ncbi:S41 family peptidase [Duganella phyllosphaerae]|nr:S41 family peptidase [Duganella phyllosphaerae]
MNIKLSPAFMAALAAVAVLSGCGGGGGSAGTTAGNGASTGTGSTGSGGATGSTDTRSDYVKLAASCQRPRSGVSAAGVRFPDRQGSLSDELKWVRSFIDESYLWYREVPTGLRQENYSNPIDYFDVLKTTAITSSGRPKDQFHFTYATDEWEASSTSGIELGYGISWSSSAPDVFPRVWRVALVEPGSPAAVAGVQRGDSLLTVDSVSLADTTQAGANTLNAGLFPQSAGSVHRLGLSRNGFPVNVQLTATRLSLQPVANVKVIDTPTGKVGYLLFNDHNAVAETQLIAAINTLKAANVTDVVLDMRYNGGGYLNIASELAYMIAGPVPTAGKVFERLQFNDKVSAASTPPPLSFLTSASGLASPVPTAAGTALPYLGLRRVTMLTTPGTCSASEAVVNGLRGVDVEVNLIGGETCGKPYGFYPEDNCGTTYFAVQFQGVNNKGFGDYANGFQPTCRISDDLSRPVGDTGEGMLSAALSYRANGICPASASRFAAGDATPLKLVRPLAKQVAILK